MVALLETGRGDEAVAVALGVGDGVSVRTATRLARISLLIGRPDVGDELLTRLPPASGADAHPIAGLRGEIDGEMGRYVSAFENLEAAVRRDAGQVVLARKAARIRGRLALLDPAWRPARIGSRVVPSGDRHRGRILHLLSISLPYSQVGYTIRSQNVARCQQAVGLDPLMVTRAGFPGNKGVHGARSRDDVDGVTYERILPDLAPGLTVDRIAAETAVGLADLVRTLSARPPSSPPRTTFGGRSRWRSASVSVFRSCTRFRSSSRSHGDLMRARRRTRATAIAWPERWRPHACAGQPAS